MPHRFPEPFSLQNPAGAFPAVFLVEHARNTMPAILKKLGLSEPHLSQHIAWDIGIEGVTRALSDDLDVPSIYCLYSRLIVDVNRPENHMEMFWPVSDGVDIPGNADISEQERLARLEGIYHPYHKAAADLVTAAHERHGDRLHVIGMHSCTDQLRGKEKRPWEIGLSSYDNEDFLQNCAALLKNHGLNVGIHEPYDVRSYRGVSLDRHGYSRGIRHLLIEIRQDLIADEEGQRQWAGILGPVFRELLA